MSTNLTWIWLQQNFCLFKNLLCPVFSTLCSGKKIFQMCVQLCFLSLAQFFLCKLEKYKYNVLYIRNNSYSLTRHYNLQIYKIISKHCHGQFSISNCTNLLVLGLCWETVESTCKLYKSICRSILCLQFGAQ